LHPPIPAPPPAVAVPDPCAIERGVENCVFCKEFECKSLKSRTGFLDEYLKPDVKISEEEYKRFILPYESKERLRKRFKEISNLMR
jgi:hypothetical protein